MRVSPLLAASALLLVGVMAFGATVVSRHRDARARRPPPPEDEPPPRFAPRAVFAPPEAPPAARAPEAPPVPAALRLRVTGPHGLVLSSPSATVTRHVDDGDEVFDLDADEDVPGVLSATELAPGRYDVVVSAPGMRDVSLAGVPTGEEIVDVSLARAPILLGALGAAAGCAGAAVSVVGAAGSEDESAVDAQVDVDDCTFVVEDLPDKGPLTLEARRGAEVARALVTLPVSGDPAPVCLWPPCAAAPASFAVYLADAAGRQVDDAFLEWTLEGDEERGEIGSDSGVAALTYVHHRHAGDTYRLVATVGDDKAEATARLGGGVTEVVLTLPAHERARRLGEPDGRRRHRRVTPLSGSRRTATPRRSARCACWRRRATRR